MVIGHNIALPVNDKTGTQAVLLVIPGRPPTVERIGELPEKIRSSKG